MTMPFLDQDPQAPTDIFSDGIERANDTPPLALPPIERELGFILDEDDEEKVAKHVIELWTRQEPSRSRRRAVWKRNRWWREGRRFVRLEKSENSNLWDAKLPRGMGNAPPVPNKTDRINRRIINTVLVDKPFPECEPGHDTNEDREAAEFATRYLTEKGSASDLKMHRLLRRAADKAETFGSAFGWVQMNPKGAGHRPRRMLAHPAAQHADDALIDPTSGLQASDDQLRERYVRPDGYLTDDSAEADLQWLPAPKVRTLTGLQVTMLPEHASLADGDAIGVIILDLTSLGEVKSLLGDEFDTLSTEKIETLCKWRPTHREDLLPPYTQWPEDQKYKDGPKAGQYMDAHPVVVATVYYERCAEYPLGCYAVIGGDTLLLHRQPWTAMVPAGDERQPDVQECLTIPVAQCRCLDDDVNDDPYGIAITEHLGPADEIRASALGFELEHMFRSANPIPMLPSGSIVQPKQLLRRDGEPIFVSQGGKPEWEQVPPLSQTVPLLREEMGNEIDDESGLQQAGQGVEGPTVKSGIHAQTIVQEALKALTGFKDNIGDYYIRLNTIILEQTRAYCTVPQLLSYTGKDGQYKAKEWSRIDFRSTKRVSISQGTFTMHGLLAKQEMANNAFDRQVIDKDDYADMMAGGISPVLGRLDNPHLMRVRNQIERWQEGPTPEWMAAKQQVDQQNAAAMQAYQQQLALAQEAAAATVSPAVDPATGAVAPPPTAPPVASPQPPQPPQLLPDPPGPFDPALPVDDEVPAAQVRHRQLARGMAEGRFLDPKYPDVWRQVYIAAYMRAKNASGTMTVAEVQRAQAAEAAQPGLPKGVSIAMKGDASTVAAEEQAALAGISGASGGGAAPDSAGTAPAAQGAVPGGVHIHLPPHQEGPKKVTHIRDAAGRITASHVESLPAHPAGVPAGVS
jgi:hypothetical protein